MAGIGIGLVFVSYSLVLYGYCLFRGYNVTPKQLFSPTDWPPKKVDTPATPTTPRAGGGRPPSFT